DRGGRGDAPALRGGRDVVTEREPGGEAAAEVVARPGRIHDAGGGGRDVLLRSSGPADEYTVAAHLHGHAPHTAADELGRGAARVVVAEEPGQFLARGQEHVGQPGHLHDLGAGPPVLVGVQRDRRRRGPLPDRGGDRGRGRQWHRRDVDDRCRVTREPPRR